MNTKNSLRLQVAAFAAACALLTGGCWPAHPHSGYRAIHQDAINGDAAGVAAELAQFPEDVNLPEDGGLTPLHLAAENCRTNVLTLLLAKGAKVDVKAKDNATPLHLAAQEGCADAVELLIARNAKINLRDDNGRTPLKRAELWHQDSVIQLLKSHGATE